jgi:hypothetical protein
MTRTCGIDQATISKCKIDMLKPQLKRMGGQPWFISTAALADVLAADTIAADVIAADNLSWN